MNKFKMIIIITIVAVLILTLLVGHRKYTEKYNCIVDGKLINYDGDLISSGNYRVGNTYVVHRSYFFGVEINEEIKTVSGK